MISRFNIKPLTITIAFLLVNAFFSLVKASIQLNLQGTDLNQPITFKSRTCTIEQIITEIEKQTKFTFIYLVSDIDLSQKIILKCQMMALGEIVNEVFVKNSYGCTISSRQIVLSKKAPEIVRISVVKPAIFKGVIISKADSTPIVGATIYAPNSGTGITSSVNGSFALQVNDHKSNFIVSALGYKPVKVSFSAGYNTIILEPIIMQLDEVCIIGYGSISRSNAIGATQTLNFKEVEPVGNSITNILSGRISGLGVTESSGAIASANTLFFRGLNSLFDEANVPLIVIDGIPLYGIGKNYNSTFFHNIEMPMTPIAGIKYKDVLNWMMGSEFERNPLSYINLNDIESVKILKDTYSTSIFGSRASGGVIMITTKSGNDTPFKLNVNYSNSISVPCNKISLVNGAEYAKIYTSVYKKMKGLDIQFPSNANTCWPDELTRIGKSNSIDISGSGYKGDAKYYTSLNYNMQQSYIRNNNFDRISGRLNLNVPFNGILSFSSANFISYINNRSINSQTLYAYSLLKPSNISLFDEYGNYSFGKGDNPIGEIYINPVGANGSHYFRDLRVTSSNSIKVKLPFNFTYNSTAGVELLYNRMLSIDSPLFSRDKELELEELLLNYKIVLDNYLELKRNFLYGHLYLTGGLSIEKSNEFRQRTQSKNVINTKATSNVNSVAIRENNEYALAAYFIRCMYSFKDKYIAGFTYRIDGSSRFSKMNRYAHSPALSLGWNVDKECWFDVSKLDNLKFRMSYGITNIDAAAYYYSKNNQYEFLNDVTYEGVPILTVKYQGIPQLKWETLSNFNIGVDLTAFARMLNVSFDYYYKFTHDMLIYSKVPLVIGASNQLINGGKMLNKGLEISASYRQKTNRILWHVAANIATNNNRILSLGGASNFRTDKEGGYKNFEVGKAAGQFYLYEWAGVNPKNGNPLWRYNDGTLSEIAPEGIEGGDAQLRNMGTATPKVFGGANFGFEYSNFKIDANVSFSYGNKLYNGTKASLMSYSTQEANNLSTDILDYWKIKGQETYVPALINKSIVMKQNGDIFDYTISRLNSRFFEDASFLRMKSITATYTIRNFFRNNTEVKLYLQGLNLVTLTKYSGLDPEVSAFGSSLLKSGYDEMTMPTAKTIILGVNLSL